MKRYQARKALKMTRCKYCHNTDNLTIDHKIPKIKGGSNDIKNLQCLCKKCNGLKSDLTDKQVKQLWIWFMWVQQEREKKGAKLYKLI